MNHEIHEIHENGGRFLNRVERVETCREGHGRARHPVTAVKKGI
jgi:hypothetical protein